MTRFRNKECQVVKYEFKQALTIIISPEQEKKLK